MSNYSNTQNGWSSADHWNTALNSQDGGEQRAQYDDVAGPAYGLAFSGFPTGPTAPFNSNVNYASQAPPVYHYTNSQQASRAVLEAAQMLPMASFTPVANVSTQFPTYEMYQPNQPALYSLPQNMTYLGNLINAPTPVGSGFYTQAQEVFHHLEPSLASVNVDYLQIRNIMSDGMIRGRQSQHAQPSSPHVYAGLQGPLAHIVLHQYPDTSELHNQTTADGNITGAKAVDPVSFLLTHEQNLRNNAASVARHASAPAPDVRRELQSGLDMYMNGYEANRIDGTTPNRTPPLRSAPVRNVTPPKRPSAAPASGRSSGIAPKNGIQLHSNSGFTPNSIGKGHGVFTGAHHDSINPVRFHSEEARPPVTPRVAGQPSSSASNTPVRSLPPDFSVKRRRSGGFVEIELPRVEVIPSPGGVVLVQDDDAEGTLDGNGSQKKRARLSHAQSRKPRSSLGNVAKWDASLKKAIRLIESIFEVEDGAAFGNSEGALEGDGALLEGGMLTHFALENLSKYFGRLEKAGHLMDTTTDVGEDGLGRLLKLLELRIEDAKYLDAGIALRGGGKSRSPRKRKGKGKPDDAHLMVEEEERVDDENDAVVDPTVFEEHVEAVLEKAEASLGACLVAMLTICAESVERKADSITPHRRLYGEDLILSIVSLVKTVLTDIVYAVVELGGREGDNLTLAVKVKRSVCENTKIRSRLSLLVTKVAEVLDKLCDLTRTENLSEDVVVPIAYVALSPFFVDISSVANLVGLDKIQFRGIHLMRTIFARYPVHRNFILEEILTSLTKISGNKKNLKQYRLPDGKSIQMVTALLLQLFQSCSSQKAIVEAAQEYSNAYELLRKGGDVGGWGASQAPVAGQGESDEKKKKKSRKSTSGDGVDAGVDAQERARQQRKEQEDQMVEKFVAACKAGTQAASKCILYALEFLTQKSLTDKNDINVKVEKGRAKRQQTGAPEAEYKAVLDNFLSDVVTVLDAPEWPAAEMVARLYSRLMIGMLEETKRQGDTAQRQMAIEWLGIVSGRIRKESAAEPQLKAELRKVSEALPAVEVDESTAPENISSLWTVQRIVSEWLDAGVEDDPANQNAKMCYLSLWGSSVITSFSNLPDDLRDTLINLLLNYSTRFLGDDATRSDLPLQHDFFLPANIAQLHSAVELRPTVAHLVEVLAQRQPLFQMFDHFLFFISNGLASDVAKIQTKALKAAQEIIAADPSVLHNSKFKNVVLSKLNDPSVSVRDAALELFTKHMLENQPVVREYYGTLAGMVSDEGTSVRKRVLKLLRDIYQKGLKSDLEEDHKMIVDASLKLLGRVTEDDEETVRDTSYRFLIEIWFSPFREAPSLSNAPIRSADGYVPDKMVWGSLSTAARKEVRQRALLICAACWRGPEAFNAFLHRIVTESEGAPLKEINICASLVECLVEEAIALEEASGANATSGQKEKIRDVFWTLSCFSKELPRLLAWHVKTLRPYLTCTNTSSVEQQISSFAIDILRNVIPFEPDHSLTDLRSIQTDLCKGLSDCSQMVLDAAVPALCAIVQYGTKDHKTLVSILQTCFNFVGRIQAELAKPKPQITDPTRRKSFRSQLILAKLLRYFDFDGKRRELDAETRRALDSISPSSILDKGFAALLSFTGGQNLSEVWLTVGISTLTDVFTAHPRLLQREDAGNRMAEILQGPSVKLKSDLLNMITKVLNRQYAKSSESAPDKRKAVQEQGQGVDIKVLIGSSEDMGDMGVGMSIMNRFLGAFLSCMLGTDERLTAAAFGLVDVALEQGIVHPVACVAAVAAMQASPDNEVRLRHVAFRRQRILYTKHNHLMHPKNIDCVRSTYEYRRRLVEASNQRVESSTEGPVILRGYTTVSQEPQAILSKLYSLLQPPVSPKAKRDEFNKNMIKMMDCNIFSPDSTIDPVLARFVAENIALLGFKNQEEVLVVLYQIHRILSITGESVRKEIESVSAGESTGVNLRRLAEASLCMGVLVLLGNHLQKLYGISSERIGKQLVKEKGTRSNERAVQRQAGAPVVLTWEELPLVEKRVLDEEDIVSQFEQFKELMANDKFFKFEEDEYGEIDDDDGIAPLDGTEVPEACQTNGNDLSGSIGDLPQLPQKGVQSSSVPRSPAKKRKSLGAKRQSLGGNVRRQSEGGATKRRRSSVSEHGEGQGTSKKRKRSLANLSDESDEDDSQADPSWA